MLKTKVLIGLVKPMSTLNFEISVRPAAALRSTG